MASDSYTLTRLRTHTLLWPYLFTTLAPLILFAPFLLGWRVLYWGTPLLQFYPWRQFALETLRAGHLPLWNPYLGNGAPLIANHQSAIFYPPNWLSLLMPLDYSFSWLVTLHLIWAGAGMVTLARTLGLRPLGQVVAGLAFGLSQYLVARAWFLSINAAVAWLPWVIWAGEMEVRSRRSEVGSRLKEGTLRGQKAENGNRIKYALLLSLFLALQLLAGHAQTTWYTLLLLGAWVLWRSYTLTHSRTYTLFLYILLPMLLAFGLSALQLLPTAELLRESPRAAAADYDFVMTYSFSPWRLFTLLAPDLLGNPARGQFYGYGNYWEDAVYVGVLPLLFAIGVIFQFTASAFRRLFIPAPSFPSSPAPPLPHPHTPTLFLILLLPVTFLLAAGRNTPIFPFFYKYVPTFNLFQAPSRMMIWFVFALALLAGLGADRWSEGEPLRGRSLYWTRLGAAGAVAITLTSALALFVISPTTQLSLQLLTVARAVMFAGIGLLISAILSLLKPKLHPHTPIPSYPHTPIHSHTHTFWPLITALFLSADLLFAGHGLNPGAPSNLYRRPTASGAALAQAIQTHRLFQFPDDEYHVKFDVLFSFKTFGPPELARAAREAQLPNLSLLDGLTSSNNFEPLVSARYADMLQVISDTRSLNLLRLMDVAAIASSAPLDLELIAEGDATDFFRVPGDVRRVRVVYTARTVADAASALAAISDPAFDPASEVILEANDSGLLAHAPTPIRPYRFSLTASPNAVTIPVSLNQPGWVVLADTYYPGWVVSVDGRPAVLRRANYAFRAVAVEDSGEHVVEFRYQPRSFAVGLGVSFVSGLVWLGAALYAWRRTSTTRGSR